MLSIFEVLNMVPKLNQENLPFYYYCDPQNASIIGYGNGKMEDFSILMACLMR